MMKSSSSFNRTVGGFAPILVALSALIAFLVAFDNPAGFPTTLQAALFPRQPQRSEGATGLQEPLFRSGRKPDNIVLAYSDKPNRLFVTWRTSTEVGDGIVQYKRADSSSFPRESRATVASLTADELDSDRTVNCFSAAMDDIEPGVAYQYRVGSPKRNAWSDWMEFGNFPTRDGDCTFVFLGDTQSGFEAVGRMLSSIERRHPETSLYLIGGDLVDHGDRRNQWDELLHHTSPVFSRKPMMPALGNHDRTEERDIFSRYLTLPKNGLDDSDECKNYYFTHGNVFFIVLDTEYSKSKQKAWLEKTLKMARDEGYSFKVAMFHKPIYHPRPGRDSASALKSWVPLFDEYGVDLVLTGHDHSYLRTRKIREDVVVPDDSAGTVYVTANSSNKHYKQQRLDIAATQFADIPTYQVIRVESLTDGEPILEYQAFNRDGKLQDAFSLLPPGKHRRGASVPPRVEPAGKAEILLGDMGQANGVKANGSLRVEGTQLLSGKGEPIQLRGMSSHGIHWYPQFTNIRALLDIKGRGANLFRVAMYADSNKNGYNVGSRDRSLNKRLLRLAVENSLAADLYTIIDWHLLEDQTPLRRMSRAVEFFDEMSRLYADEPGILYEICNEPNGSTTWKEIAEYAEKVIPVIRKNSPDAVIIVGTPKYSFDVLSVLDSPLPYDNIMYAFHMYTGYTNYDFRRILDTARTKGLPVFVSEWGISKEKGQDLHDVAEGYDFLEYMWNHNLSWAYWALCNADREYVVIKPEVEKLSGWLEEDLTIPGKIIFSALADGVAQRTE